MRVAILSAGEIFTARWTNAFVESGYDVHLIVQEQVVEEFKAEVKIHLLPFRRPWGGILNVVSLKRLLRKIEPDLLHVFAASLDGLLGRLTGFHPSVLSVLGSDVFDFPYQSRLKRGIVVKNLKYYDWIGSTSHVMAEEIVLLNPETRNMTVTPFGVDTQVFSPALSRKNGEFLTIGTVKTMHEKYGIDILLRAFASALGILSRTKPDVGRRIRLLIVGGGPLLDEMRSLAEDLGIQSVVEFTGYVANKRVPEFLSSMDIFVAMSRMESFGVAVIEASACSLPVIVSNAGGLPEVVQDGYTGFIVEKEDVSATRDAMIRLIEDQELRSKMGKAGREYVRNNYEWSKCVDIMMDLHHQTLRRRDEL
jgi:glycosyltransferase involved in cell wall biosynthesis